GGRGRGGGGEGGGGDAGAGAGRCGRRRVQRPGGHEKTGPGPSVRGEVGRLCRSLRRLRSQVIDPGGSRRRRHARGGTRTHKPLRATDFESAAFADFATRAEYYNITEYTRSFQGLRGPQDLPENHRAPQIPQPRNPPRPAAAD